MVKPGKEGLTTLFYWAKPALIVMGVWARMGGPNMLLFLAGLTSIPVELYEAAAIDGTGRWQRFKHITWPLLSPTTFFILIMGIIYGLQGGFEMAYVMTQGGPSRSTDMPGIFMFEITFRGDFFARGAAIGIVMLIMVALLIVPYLAYSRRMDVQ